MLHTTSTNKIQHYFTQVRLLPSGSFRTLEVPEIKLFFQRLFPEVVQDDDLSSLEVQRRLVQTMQSDSSTHARQAEASLRCFVSHHILFACKRLERQYYTQKGFRAMEVLPYVMTDIDPLKSKLQYEKEYEEKFRAMKDCESGADCKARKDYKFQPPLAVQIVCKFNPEKGNLSTWTSLLTLQQRDLNRVLNEYGISQETDWSILNHTKSTRIKRLLASVLTAAEIESMCAVLEGYHAVYRQARLVSGQAGKRCKAPTSAQLEMMVSYLAAQHGINYSSEQILQTLQSLALNLRRRPIENSVESQDWHSVKQSKLSPSPEEEAQSQLLQYQRELLHDCLNQAIEQVLTDHLAHLRHRKNSREQQTLTKERMFLQAMRLYYCENRSMTEIAHILGQQHEYQVSRLLELKAIRQKIREPWLNLARNRIVSLLAAYVDSERLHQSQQQIDEMITMQIDQLIAEEAANSYRINRSDRTLFAESFCRYLTSPN